MFCLNYKCGVQSDSMLTTQIQINSTITTLAKVIILYNLCYILHFYT